MSKHVAVEVRVDGEMILCLETNSMCGVNGIEQYLPQLREARDMLQGFIGPDNRAPFIEEDPYQTAEYQQFVESMVQFCHCGANRRPCDGVLAGGLCDGITDDEDDDYRERDDEDDDEY